MANVVSWVVVADTDLNDYLTVKAMDAFRQKVLAVGQSNPFTNVMHDVTNMIRGYIGKRYTLSATPYAIPPDMKWIACLLIIEAMESRLPGVNLIETMKARIEDARAYLQSVNDGTVAVDLPADPLVGAPLQVPGGIQVVTSNCHRFSLEQLRYL